MSPFPSTAQDLAELERFLAAELPVRLATDPRILELRQGAERLALRLANPVRVAITGLPGAGKTTLASFLAGQIYAPPRAQRGGAALPVILRYCETPETIAGWWSGIEIPYRGIEPQSAAEHGPDYIELRLPNPVLEFISFLDMPGVDDWQEQKEQMGWIGGRADVVIWCTRAADPWTDDEWQLWSLVPRRVQARSLLVVTQTDQARDALAFDETLQRLQHVTRNQFAEVVPLGTRAALEAAPAGRVIDTGSWEQSGGRAMVGALLGAARAVRRTDIAAARELLAEAAEALGLAPTREAGGESEAVRPMAAPAAPPLSAAAEAVAEAVAEAAAQGVRPGRPRSRTSRFKEVAELEEQTVPPPDEAAPEAAAPVTPPAEEGPAAEIAEVDISADEITARTEDPIPAEAAPVVAEPAPAPPAAPSPLLALLSERTEALIAYAQGGNGFKDWEFMAQITDLADELSAMTISSRALRPEAAWIKPQVEDALVALSLLQMEQGERPCEDAAVVVLQLARDLAWAAAPRAA